MAQTRPTDEAVIIMHTDPSYCVIQTLKSDEQDCFTLKADGPLQTLNPRP